MIDLPFTIPSLRAAYADGTKPEDVIGEVYRRIAAVDDPGIFIHLFSIDDVMADARNLGAFDPEKPLYGIPFAIKDNIDTAGHPTTAACPAYAYTAETDAFVVAKLREAGALLVGKTNLDQFATGLVGVRSPFPPPENAIDPAIVPGGSSSGSAVAVAHGIVSFALGTDTAGSGRVPAALNNIVGLKPTLGALSASGVVPACRTLDTVSIFALSVDDAYDVFRTAAVYDPDDAYARPIQPHAMSAPPSFRLGIPSDETIEFFGDDHQAEAFNDAVDSLRGLGAEVTSLDFTPFFELADMLYQGAWVAERFTVIEALLADDPEQVHPVTRQIVGRASKLSAADAFRDAYRLQELKSRIRPALQKIDLLAVPSIPTFYTTDDLAADPVGPNNRLGIYTNFVNLLDLAGIAVPTGPRSDGRPGSVTLLAESGQDGLAASIARRLHATVDDRLGATAWRLPPPDQPTLAVTGDEIEIAVCGAHMAGLPLNRELTERGGRFLRADETAPSYRLFALPGGPPVRPGLVRVPNGDGRAIKLEVWALPTGEVGSFLKSIPSPLGLGSVELADGHLAKGFLCEQAGIEGATDISSFGGWRAYVQEEKP
ncbi:MAG: allophanate hydrolase [Pseudomonadota bacterium]